MVSGPSGMDWQQRDLDSKTHGTLLAAAVAQLTHGTQSPQPREMATPVENKRTALEDPGKASGHLTATITPLTTQ